MTRMLPERGVWSAPVALTALSIGMWEDDVEIDRIRGDAIMARIYGLSEERAAAGLTWAELSRFFHPDDMPADPLPHRRVREEGGLFVWEHRVVPEAGNVRWVLARGHFDRDSQSGVMRGRGILIDMTDVRRDGHADGSMDFLAKDMAAPLLERIADGALQIRGMIDDLNPKGVKRLKPLVDALLLELGRQLAASLMHEAVPPPTVRRH
ncbi:PAS domain-containing protein [Methylobacterium sp. E-025]|uniref:PAS domain-containing protein n=1 Tax=Methylobacterium sp. E-025 TaxID=2836561 RepID=UPI001FBA5BCC|nr:PAS domain-containing protein [Methylobacterium sp. E-025]MCJ2111573.1 PAS domain-containing protein [Methylobacterium sp. E-025]